MGMTIKIRMLLASREMTISNLAEKLNPPTSKQNITSKLKRDNFTERDLQEIAKACNATYEGSFILNDTGKSI